MSSRQWPSTAHRLLVYHRPLFQLRRRCPPFLSGDGHRRSASAASSSPSTATCPPPHPHHRFRLGIGGSRLARSHDPVEYAQVLRTALKYGVSTFESGHGGEERLAEAYRLAVRNHRDEDEKKANGGAGFRTEEEPGSRMRVTLTARFGYRTLHRDGAEPGEGLPHDVVVEGDSGGDKSGNGNADAGSPAKDVAVHNMSQMYAAQCLESSPLVQLRKDLGPDEVNLLYMAHNPEAQGSSLAARGAPLDEVRGHARERLTDAFVGLERAVEEGLIGGYGVCSNGLSLPPDHPLFLGWRDVLESSADAASIVRGTPTETRMGHSRSGLAVLQLPANPLETRGLAVARDIKSYLAAELDLAAVAAASGSKDSLGNDDDRDDDDESRRRRPFLPSSLQVYITRPLTCYPDGGTGSSRPFKLVDYKIPTGLLTPDADGTPHHAGESYQWTHLLEGSTPPNYGPALNAAMGHFDATHLLEQKAERKLTTEERETLDGCRLLQSMLHDLDNALGSVRSFAAYEDELYTKVVPLINDTFEGLDEESAAVLQAFFAAHGAAVRHAVARTTRELLREGGDGVPPYDVPNDVTLQEFALQFLLKEDAVDKVIVGCPRPEHVLEAVRAVDRLDLAAPNRT